LLVEDNNNLVNGVTSLKDVNHSSQDSFPIQQGKNLVHPTHPLALSGRHNDCPYFLLLVTFHV
jgi:hypothetical protein